MLCDVTNIVWCRVEKEEGCACVRVCVLRKARKACSMMESDGKCEQME
jgi:hypothetical protein